MIKFAMRSIAAALAGLAFAACSDGREGSAQTTAAEAKKKTAQKKAKSELEDARANKLAATEARADAERLEELTAAKKQERTNS